MAGDTKMLADGDSKPVDLDVGKFSWWVRHHFGSVMTARFLNFREIDPVTMAAPAREVSVPARFVETFLAVADFCLREDPLENKAVPTSRIKKLWEMVPGGAAWNQRYFQVVRERLHRMGVIRICDRNHESGKAWLSLGSRRGFPRGFLEKDRAETAGRMGNVRRSGQFG